MIKAKTNKPLAYTLICLAISLTCFAIYFALYSEFLIFAPTFLGIASLFYLLAWQKMGKWSMDNSKFNSYVQKAATGILLFTVALLLFRDLG